MIANRLEEITNRQVDAELFGVRKAVNALAELCRLHTDGVLLDVTQERIDAEFKALANEIADKFNGLIARFNEERARTAGEGVNMHATEGMEIFTTATNEPVVFRSVGFSRIGQTDAWCLCLDCEEIDGATLTEDAAERIMRAVRAWKSDKRHKEDAVAKGAAEKEGGEK